MSPNGNCVGFPGGDPAGQQVRCRRDLILNMASFDRPAVRRPWSSTIYETTRKCLSEAFA